MKKTVIVLLMLSTLAHAQVGIGTRAPAGKNPQTDPTENPRGILHLQGQHYLNDSITRNVGLVIPKVDDVDLVRTPKGAAPVEGTMVFVSDSAAGAKNFYEPGGIRIKTKTGWQDKLTDEGSIGNLFNYDIYGGLNVRVKKVSAGNQYTLVIGYEDETVYAGGNNAYGQTGLGTNRSTTATFKMALAQKTQDISAGYSHSLAVAKDGTVWAWGNNTYYRAGLEKTSQYAFPVKIKDIPLLAGDTIKRVEAGGVNSLLLSKNGDVFSFGNDIYGLNGNGLSSNRTNVQVPTLVRDLSGIVIKDIALSSASAAAVDKGGNVWVWGNQQFGRLGNGNNDTKVARPTQIKIPARVKQVALGSSHGLAVSEDGKRLYGWGANQGWGVLGDTKSVATTPVEITKYLNGFDPATETIIYIAATRFTTASETAAGSAITGGSLIITDKNVYAAGSKTNPDRYGLGHFRKSTEILYSPTSAKGYRGTIMEGMYPIYDKAIYKGTDFEQASMGPDHTVMKQTIELQDDGTGTMTETGGYGYGMGDVQARQLGAIDVGFKQLAIPSLIKK